MPIKLELPQRARHVHIYDEDWELLESLFGKTGPRPIGVSNAIRLILHSHCGTIKQRIADRIDSDRAVPDPEEYEDWQTMEAASRS